MGDYISREAVVRYLKGYSESELNKNGNFGMITSSVLNKVERALSEMPAADVQPVKHGRWIRHGKPEDYFWNCSECKNWIIYAEHDLHKHHFCGNCGCRMDGDSE